MCIVDQKHFKSRKAVKHNSSVKKYIRYSISVKDNYTLISEQTIILNTSCSIAF